MTTTPEQPSASASKSNGDDDDGDDDMLDDLKNVYKLAILTTPDPTKLIYYTNVRLRRMLISLTKVWHLEKNKIRESAMIFLNGGKKKKTSTQ